MLSHTHRAYFDLTSISIHIKPLIGEGFERDVGRGYVSSFVQILDNFSRRYLSVFLCIETAFPSLLPPTSLGIDPYIYCVIPFSIAGTPSAFRTSAMLLIKMSTHLKIPPFPSDLKNSIGTHVL